VSISKNIKSLRSRFNISQKELGDICGVSISAVSNWENGLNEPRMGAIQKIADHFSIPKSAIIEEGGIYNYINGAATPATQLLQEQQDDMLKAIPGAMRAVANSVPMPLYGSIAAGSPGEMNGDVLEYIDVPRQVADKYPSAFLVPVSGDSMDLVIQDGDYALIDPCEDVHSGQVVAVAVDGCDATLKRFQRIKTGVILEPESSNPEHEPQFYSAQVANERLSVIGRLVWHMPPFNMKY